MSTDIKLPYFYHIRTPKINWLIANFVFSYGQEIRRRFFIKVVIDIYNNNFAILIDSHSRQSALIHDLKIY